MGKKKKEHIVFDQILTTKKSIPFTKINQKTIHKLINIHEKKNEQELRGE